MAVDPGGVAPVSAIYLWLGRGAAAETEAELGAAHLLEHMLFKGAGAHGVTEAATRIEGMGGDLNAYTSYEQTVLHATVPAGREEEVIALLAEMALDPHLDAAQLDREQDVVVEEIRGARDDAADQLAEALRARAHQGHPYGRPILGREETVRALDAAALGHFHRQHHRPAHAILAVAGPVDPLAIRDAAAGHLLPRGPHAAAPVPPRALGTTQPGAFLLPGFEERVVELAWALPGLAHADIPALDLLATALGDGDAAILNQRLRDELGCAIDTWAALENEPDRGLLVVGCLARKGKVGACARALSEAVVAAARQGLPAADLRRARRTVLSSRLYERETVDGRAHTMAWYLANHGDLEAEALYEAHIRAVRLDDLARVAATWLAPDRAVIGAVAPPSEISARTLATRVLDPGKAPRVTPAGASGGLVRRTLSCGATLVVQADPHAELAAVSLVGVGGMISEGARHGGLSGSWAQTVTRGAGELSAAELAQEIEDRAGSLRAWRARNSMGMELRFPEGDLHAGLGLLGQILCAPTFAEDEVERAVQDLAEAREALACDDPGGLAMQLAWSALYPGHPWGRSPLGSEGADERITPGALRRLHRRCMVGRNLVIAVAGAVDPDEVARRLDRVLATLPVGAPVMPAPPTPSQRPPPRRRRRSEREQAHLVIALPALGHGDPRTPAQRLLEGVLSGQSGRLFLEVRESLGLAYSVDATANEGLGAGTLVISAAVDPDRVAAARAALWSVLDRLRNEEVPAEELERVKCRVVDGAALGLQRAADRAGHLASAERYGPGAEHWREVLAWPRQVQAGALRALAGDLLRADRAAEAEVGPHLRRG